MITVVLVIPLIALAATVIALHSICTILFSGGTGHGCYLINGGYARMTQQIIPLKYYPIMAKYGKKAGNKVERALHEMHEGKLKSGRSGQKVTNPKQAIAIGLSEAREAGGKAPEKKAPAKKAAPGKKAAAKKAAPKKKAAARKS